VIVHEVAHQWWNAVVGSDSRRHSFVDEVLANYSAAAHFACICGLVATERQLDMMMRLNYHFARLTGMPDQPVDQPTSQFEGLLDYGAIVYGKGALFFWELREVIGDETLHRLLSHYYQTHKFVVATGEALRGALSAYPQKSAEIKKLTRRWLDETHGDEDIEGVSLYRTLKVLLGDLGLAQLSPEMRRWLNHRGVDALADLIERSIRAGRLSTEELDYEAITSLLTDLMSEEPELSKWLGIATRVLSNPHARPSDLLKEVGREIQRDDPRTGLILESAGLLFDAFTNDHPRDSSRDSK
jgi:hypothetical protein